MVCSECIQLVTEDAVIKKRRGHEERQQEWSDVKLLYLLQLRYCIVTCVCIHMMRDEESSESHDKVPTNLTHSALFLLSALSLSIIRDWVSYLRSYQSSVIRYTHSTLSLN